MTAQQQTQFAYSLSAEFNKNGSVLIVSAQFTEQDATPRNIRAINKIAEILKNVPVDATKVSGWNRYRIGRLEERLELHPGSVLDINTMGFVGEGERWQYPGPELVFQPFIDEESIIDFTPA